MANRLPIPALTGKNFSLREDQTGVLPRLVLHFEHIQIALRRLQRFVSKPVSIHFSDARLAALIRLSRNRHKTIEFSKLSRCLVRLSMWIAAERETHPDRPKGDSTKLFQISSGRGLPPTYLHDTCNQPVPHKRHNHHRSDGARRFRNDSRRYLYDTIDTRSACPRPGDSDRKSRIKVYPRE